VLLLVLGSNVILLLLGGASFAGWAELLADIGRHLALGALDITGPFSLANSPQTMGITLGLGVIFAAAYRGLFGFETVGVQLRFDIGPTTEQGQKAPAFKRGLSAPSVLATNQP
jgi:hypothetical protein